MLRRALVTALLTLAALPAAALGSTTFAVDDLGDCVDASPGDGQCVATPSDRCTLRAAVMEANATAGEDTINLPGDTITLSRPGTGEDAAATGDLDVTDPLIVHGAGAALTT